jgi:hypothetical protein
MMDAQCTAGDGELRFLAEELFHRLTDVSASPASDRR